MKKTIFSALVALSTCWGQESDFTTTLNVGPGFPDSPEYVLIQVPEIYSAVIFSWPRYIAGCPTTRFGDFLLKKTSATPGHLISKPVCPIVGNDSAVFNTSSVYEVPTFFGTLYYMTVIEPGLQKMKVRITKEKPSVVLPKIGQRSRKNIGQVLADGKSVSAPSASNRVLFQTSSDFSPFVKD
jgi:hypothetical protein